MEKVSGPLNLHSTTERIVDKYLPVSWYDIDDEGYQCHEQDMTDLESSELLPKGELSRATNRGYFCALLQLVQKQPQLYEKQINICDTTSDIDNEFVILMEKEKRQIEGKRCYDILNPELMNGYSFPQSSSSSNQAQGDHMTVPRSVKNNLSQAHGGGWIVFPRPNSRQRLIIGGDTSIASGNDNKYDDIGI
ncbi:hypothetical protein BTUL_0384g00060 [Botrytis tulipae]|uniref:Uncharacterized protein n=1 Tax=Botrytis tulipae TaxID=87230 RepID=A0A4Z1E6Z2_9HELO|nr:hypothetical protein BTUL_0384g00060 [Botrytis tulipae]